VVIANFTWGKWRGIVREKVDEFAVILTISEKNKDLSIECSLETIYRQFPPAAKEETGIKALDWLIEHYGPKEKDMLEKWIDFETPRLIEMGASRGYWSS
jgi:hypothetical protein